MKTTNLQYKKLRTLDVFLVMDGRFDKTFFASCYHKMHLFVKIEEIILQKKCLQQ